jgi:hypothetical protein
MKNVKNIQMWFECIKKRHFTVVYVKENQPLIRIETLSNTNL